MGQVRNISSYGPCITTCHVWLIGPSKCWLNWAKVGQVRNIGYKGASITTGQGRLNCAEYEWVKLVQVLNVGYSGPNNECCTGAGAAGAATFQTPPPPPHTHTLTPG